MAKMAEKPYETYERLTGRKWTSGTSDAIQNLLARYNIKAPAGSSRANLALQRALLNDETLTGEVDRETLPELPRTLQPGRTGLEPNPIDVGYKRLATSSGGSVRDEFTPAQLKLIADTLPVAASLYGLGAGVGAAGGLGVAAAADMGGAGLAEYTPELFTQEIRDALVSGNRDRLRALITNAEQTAGMVRGGAQRLRAMKALDTLKSQLNRSMNPLD